MIPNPYHVGQPVPPADFVGRTSEVAAAFDQIYNRSNLAIWGGPGMGKTSFLELLASPQVWNKYGQDPSSAVTVLFSCQAISPFTAAGFWQQVFMVLHDGLDNQPQLQGEVKAVLEQGKANKDSLRRILRQLGKQNQFLLLLVDDYDAALHTNDSYSEAEMEAFVSECRSLAYHSRERKHLAMIVTSLKRLNELGPPLNPVSSPWYNHYLFQSLKPFTQEGIERMLGKIPLEPQLIDAMRDIAGGHPTLLQIAGSVLYRELMSGKKPNPEAFANNFASSTQQVFQTLWLRCSEVEQTLLMLMALVGLKGRLYRMRYDLSDLDLIFSQRERELINLEEQGIIVSKTQAQKRVYCFTSVIMERWVIQEISNSDDPSLQQRQKVFLNLMSHAQAQRVTLAIRWLWQHKEEIPSLLEWFARVSAALPQGAVQGLLDLGV